MLDDITRKYLWKETKSSDRPISTAPYGPPGQKRGFGAEEPALPRHSHVSPPSHRPPSPGCPGNQARSQARHQPTASSGRARGPAHPRLLSPFGIPSCLTFPAFRIWCFRFRWFRAHDVPVHFKRHTGVEEVIRGSGRAGDGDATPAVAELTVTPPGGRWEATHNNLHTTSY
ncbi:unnamed protein product [Arctogadus glacialis]